MIPLFKVFMSSDVDNFILPVLHSGYIGEGEQTKIFEKKFGEFIENDNVVVVNSGTSAITMALKLAGIGHGDKVISTPMNCLATNMAILSVGAIPVWADILPDGTMDPEDVEQKMTGKIKAIVCMDWGGTPCKLDEIGDIARKYGIPVIEDACQSIGSEYGGIPVGHDADFVAFSFQAIKTLTTGDGGALAINYDSRLVETAKQMRWFGLDRTKGADMRCNQDPPVAGYKWQMNDIAASIGLANIRTLQTRIDITKRNADFYNDEFRQATDFQRKSGYWLYTLLVRDSECFIRNMKEHGVECSKVHDRNDKKTIFGQSEIPLPGVDDFDKHHVCIPVGWWLFHDEVEKIANLVKRFK